MERTVLLPLLVSVWMVPWLVSAKENGGEGISQKPSYIYHCEAALKSPEGELMISPKLDFSEPPSLSLHPKYQMYFTGETVGLMCSAPPSVGQINGMEYYSDVSWATTIIVSSGKSFTINLTLTGPPRTGSYTCTYSISGTQSSRSNPVTIQVTDLPLQPELIVNPSSGVMSKGKHLVITCISPEDVEEKRFYFYKDGAKIVPGNKDFEFSPVEPGSGSKNNSVLSIPRANPNITGEFTCEYEKKVSGRWVTSQRSQAVKVTIAEFKCTLTRLLAVGGSFFTINGLIFLIACICMKHGDSQENAKNDMQTKQKYLASFSHKKSSTKSSRIFDTPRYVPQFQPVSYKHNEYG